MGVSEKADEKFILDFRRKMGYDRRNGNGIGSWESHDGAESG